MARLRTNFPNHSSVEFRRETYSTVLKDSPKLPPFVRNCRAEGTGGVLPALQYRPGTHYQSSSILSDRSSIDGELSAHMTVQEGMDIPKRESLWSRSPRAWKRASSVPMPETVRASSKIRQRLPLRTTPKLQLPSFDLLGIANPHPDNYRPPGQSTRLLYARWSSDSECCNAETDPVHLPELIVEGRTTPGLETSALLTPPDEHTTIDCVTPRFEDSGNMTTTPTTDFDASTMGIETLSINAASSEIREGTTASEMRNTDERTETGGELSAAAQPSSHQEAEMSGSESGQGWLEQAIAVACKLEYSVIISFYHG